MSEGRGWELARLLSGGIAVLVTSLGGACSGDDRDDEISAFDVPEWVLDLDPAANRAAWIGLPPEQKDLLTDGGLRFDEYTQAIRATADCVSDRGHTVASPATDAAGVRLLWPATPAAGVPAAQYYSEVAQCVDQHSHYIQYLWSLLEPPSAEELRAAQEVVEGCMADAGIGMPRMDSEEFDDWIRDDGAEEGSNQFGRCAVDAAMATGVNVFYAA